MSTPTMQQIAALAGLKPVSLKKPIRMITRPHTSLVDIVEADGRLICPCDESDATEIVNAVNSFDDLVAACREMFPAYRISALEHCENTTEVVEARQRIDKIKALIAKSEHKSQSGHATITLLWFVGFASAAFLWMLWSLMKAAL